MKKIKFLKGFRSVLTKEQYWKQLDVVELDDAKADALVARGVAEYCAVKLPEWTDERHKYVIMGGIELAAYCEGDKWFVKTGRCNMCGKCCENMTATEHFPVDENGTCKFLVPDGEKRVCGLYLSRPFSCSISPGRGRSHISDEDCTECFEEVE